MTWSLRTRIIHWMIAIPVMINFFLEGGELTHKVLGYLALGIVFYRLVWGFIARDQAHFSAFPFSQVFKPKRDYPGHNPQASWVYLCIWLLVISLGISGFMMGLDAYWGEEWLEELHEVLSQCLMFFVGAHLLGVAYDSWKFRRKTWLGLFTGKR